MKKLFFTSNIKNYKQVGNFKVAKEIDNINGIVDQLKCAILNFDSILCVASSPDDIQKVNAYANILFDGFKMSGISFKNYNILDNRTRNKAKEYVENADLVFLSGGDTYIQNQFFKEINLKNLLKEYNGVIIGQSAGSLNMAESVYNSPEYGNESKQIYFNGLGLSNINIEPHFCLSTINFNELETYQRNNILEESKKRTIFALCDGSHIFETDQSIDIYGEAYIIKNGDITKICENGCKYNIFNVEKK